MRLCFAALALLLALGQEAGAATNLVAPIQTYACASHTWANSLALATGATTCTQPAIADTVGLENAIANLANLGTLGLANRTQTIFGPQPNLSAQAAGDLTNMIMLKTPSTPIKTSQGAGATVYSYQLTGNAYAGANGGTGEFLGLGYNASGDKELIVGDFDNINTTNACLNIQSAGGGIRLLGAYCNNAGTANINFGGTTGVTGVVSSSGIFLQDSAGFGYLSIPANNTFHWGNADAATAAAQTIGVQGVVAGTSNVAGANFTIAGSQGTGTGAGGSLVFQVAPAGASGTAQNALTTSLTIAPNGTGTMVQLPDGSAVISQTTAAQAENARMLSTKTPCAIPTTTTLSCPGFVPSAASAPTVGMALPAAGKLGLYGTTWEHFSGATDTIDYGVSTASVLTLPVATTLSNATVKISGLSLAGQTDIMCISSSTGALSYDTTVALCTGSDERTKTAMKPISAAHSLDIVLRSKPISFYYLPEAHQGNDYHLGFGAQTLAAVAPELVLHDKAGVPNALKLTEFAPITWAAMQQMQREIESVRADNDNLRNEIGMLRAQR